MSRRQESLYHQAQNLAGTASQIKEEIDDLISDIAEIDPNEADMQTELNSITNRLVNIMEQIA